MKIDTIIDSYQDYKEYDVPMKSSVRFNSDETFRIFPSSEKLFEGKMFVRTVKVRRANGMIALETELLTDEEVETEKNGNNN